MVHLSDFLFWIPKYLISRAACDEFIIILQEMKIGISENSFFSVFHADASDLFNVCSNLEKVGFNETKPQYMGGTISIRS